MDGTIRHMFETYKKYIKDNPQGYWFKAKLYGWGWTPATWQGWVTMLVFMILIIFNAWRLENITSDETIFATRYLWQTFVLVGLLILICFAKGEKPSFRWGLPDKYHQDKKDNYKK